MSSIPIIGLCGEVGSGKSTAAAHLAEVHGYIRGLGFAASLKEAVLSVYRPMGMEHRHVFGSQADKLEPLPRILGPDGRPTYTRRILEVVGTEGFRAACPDTWVDNLLESWEATGCKPLVIEDVRFTNEFLGIRKRGGEVWEIRRAGWVAPTDDATKNHASDREWRALTKNHVIHGGEGIPALQEAVTRALAYRGEKRS